MALAPSEITTGFSVHAIDRTDAPCFLLRARIERDGDFDLTPPLDEFQPGDSLDDRPGATRPLDPELVHW